MARQIVAVASHFLLDRRAEWDEGYVLVGPDDIASGKFDPVAKAIEVVVTTGDALDPRLLDALPNLKLVACFSTGYAGIDLRRLRARGVALTTAAGVNAHDVADHAIALMLAWWHGIPRADRNVRGGTWKEGLIPRPSLRGRRAGIVGLGRIGLEIARRAAVLGLSVGWWGPRGKPAATYPRAESLLALARDSDILLLATRATPDNAAQINDEVLAALGANGLLVNVSRGLLVDEAALIRALDAGIIAGAALDVFAEEPASAQTWSRFENVVLTPHIAGYTSDAGVAMFGQLRENIRRYFAREPLLRPATTHSE
ncbi:MAG: NAD(P)-dependent oxidoreductase [Gammaproteobacteria bacterium]